MASMVKGIRGIILRCLIAMIALVVTCLAAHANVAYAITWTNVNLPDGRYKIATYSNSGYVLDVKNGGTANETDVDVWQDTGGARQRWILRKVSGQSYYIFYSLLNPTNLVLDEVNGTSGITDNTNAYVYTLVTNFFSSGQAFYVSRAPIDSSYYVIRVADTEYCLNRTGTLANGNTVKMWRQSTADGSRIAWNMIPINYQVRFNANGGLGTMPNQTIQFDTNGTRLTANGFTKPGWTFTGWNTARNGSGTNYSNQQSVVNLTSTEGATVTLYAQWQPVGTAYAVLTNSSDPTYGAGTLLFFRSNSTYSAGTNQTVTDINGRTYKGQVYTGIETFNSSTSSQSVFAEYAMWKNERSSIVRLRVASGQMIRTLSMNGWFYNCSNLADVDMTGFDTSATTNLRALFWSCTALSSINFRGLDFSSCGDIAHMFNGCTHLTSIDLGDMSSAPLVTIDSLFERNSALEHVNVSRINTKLVWTMGKLFKGCSSLKSVDLSTFDNTTPAASGNRATVSYTNEMFAGCSSLRSVTLSNKFSFYGVPGTPSTYGYGVLPTPPSSTTTGKWVKANRSVGPFTPEYLRDNWAANASSWAGRWIWDDPQISGTAYAVLTNANDSTYGAGTLLFFRSGNAYSNGANQTVTDIYGNTYKGQVYTGIESYNLYSAHSAEYCNYAYWKNERASISSVRVAPNQVIIAPSTVCGWFYGCSNLASVDMRGFDTAGVAQARGLFNQCSSLFHIDLGMLDWCSLRDIAHMFMGCASLTDMDYGDMGASPLYTIDALFAECSSLEHFTLSKLNTASAYEHSNMFRNCISLREVDLTEWDTISLPRNGSQCCWTYQFFINCPSLSSVTFGKRFSFHGAPNTPAEKYGILPTPPSSITTGKWVKADKSAGPLTPEAFRDSWDANASSWAGEWVWDRTVYTVHFDANGGTGTMANATWSYGTYETLPVCGFSFPGKGFMRWNTQPDNSGTAYYATRTTKDIASLAEGEVTLYACWLDNATIEYDGNGATGSPVMQDVEPGRTGQISGSPFVRPGYVFTGWNTHPDGSGKAYAVGQHVHAMYESREHTFVDGILHTTKLGAWDGPPTMYGNLVAGDTYTIRLRMRSTGFDLPNIGFHIADSTVLGMVVDGEDVTAQLHNRSIYDFDGQRAWHDVELSISYAWNTVSSPGQPSCLTPEPGRSLSTPTGTYELDDIVIEHDGIEYLGILDTITLYAQWERIPGSGDDIPFDNLTFSVWGTVGENPAANPSESDTSLQPNPDSDGDGIGDNVMFTIPTEVTCVVKADGTLICPSTGKIQNLSPFAIHAIALQVDEVSPFSIVSDASLSSEENAVSISIGPAGDQMPLSSCVSTKMFVPTPAMWFMGSTGEADSIALAISGRVANLSVDATTAQTFGLLHFYVTKG